MFTKFLACAIVASVATAYEVTEDTNFTAIDAWEESTRNNGEQWVKNYVKKNACAKFGSRQCSYCVQAKKFFQSIGATLSEVDFDTLNRNPSSREVQQALSRLTGSEYMPYMYIGGKYVGGYSDVKELDRAGKLRPLLKKVGCLKK